MLDGNVEQKLCQLQEACIYKDVYKRQQDSSEPVVEFKKSSRSAKEYIALAEEMCIRDRSYSGFFCY